MYDIVPCLAEPNPCLATDGAATVLEQLDYCQGAYGVCAASRLCAVQARGADMCCMLCLRIQAMLQEQYRVWHGQGVTRIAESVDLGTASGSQQSGDVGLAGTKGK